MPKLFVSVEDRSWKYSFVLTLSNFLAFIFVAVSYVAVYVKTQRTASDVGGRNNGKQNSRSEYQNYCCNLTNVYEQRFVLQWRQTYTICAYRFTCVRKPHPTFFRFVTRDLHKYTWCRYLLGTMVIYWCLHSFICFVLFSVGRSDHCPIPNFPNLHSFSS